MSYFLLLICYECQRCFNPLVDIPHQPKTGQRTTLKRKRNGLFYEKLSVPERIVFSGVLWHNCLFPHPVRLQMAVYSAT